MIKKFRRSCPELKVSMLTSGIPQIESKKPDVTNKIATSKVGKSTEYFWGTPWKNDESGWYPFFQQLTKDGTLSKISKFLQEESKDSNIYPQPDKIFNVMSLTKLRDIKVLILGQDPYHTPGAAMGLAFSHNPTQTKIQPSLVNIYKELQSDGYDVSNPKSGDISIWASRGVFLINTALTVKEGKANSHSKIWIDNKKDNSSFTAKLLRYISENCNHLVVIAWGNPAQLCCKKHFDCKKHFIIESVHPSPLSAHGGFFGSKPFSKTNIKLESWGIKPINWNL